MPSAVQGGIAITRAEAEVLFDINDASQGANNDPEWTDLFVKAIANCIMAASGYQPPPREVALARERWLDSPDAGVGGFFAKMAAGGLKGIIKAYTAPADAGWAARNAAMQRNIRAAEVVTGGEAEWLAERIRRDGHVGENEKALLRFIGNEAPAGPSVSQRADLQRRPDPNARGGGRAPALPAAAIVPAVPTVRGSPPPWPPPNAPPSPSSSLPKWRG